MVLPRITLSWPPWPSSATTAADDAGTSTNSAPRSVDAAARNAPDPSVEGRATTRASPVTISGDSPCAVTSEITALGAQIYCWARVASVPLYAWGVRHLRSLAWLISIVGLGMIAQAILLP